MFIQWVLLSSVALLCKTLLVCEEAEWKLVRVLIDGVRCVIRELVMNQDV